MWVAPCGDSPEKREVEGGKFSRCLPSPCLASLFALLLLLLHSLLTSDPTASASQLTEDQWQSRKLPGLQHQIGTGRNSTLWTEQLQGSQLFRCQMYTCQTEIIRDQSGKDTASF